MENLDVWLDVADLVGRAEAIVEARERQDPGDWAMTAFNRYRIGELLGLPLTASYGGDLQADPVVLLEEAARVVERFVAPAGERSWWSAVADALRSVLADVRMVQSASDL